LSAFQIFLEKILSVKYKLNNITFLGLPQASVDNAPKNNWDNVIENDYGVVGGRNYKEYKQNFQKLFKKLSIELDKFKKIYTHNPWGEYGHVEHIQVHRCITKLSKIKGFEIFVFGYLSRDTIKLASFKLETLGPILIKKKNDIELFQKIKNLYMHQKCWTWSDFYTPPNYELFYQFKVYKNLPENNTLNKKNLIYIYHPIYSRRVRCFLYDSSSIIFKIFVLQNKYFFKFRTFILNLFLRSLIKQFSNFKR
jgi:hypothetical protein